MQIRFASHHLVGVTRRKVCKMWAKDLAMTVALSLAYPVEEIRV